ncbi:MAG: glycosyltransferase family 39 protein, partial [Promethearchaeota archaeon]
MKFKIKQNKKFNFKFIHYIYFSYFILLGIIVFFPLDFILILIPDDSFYYFETAKNVALYGNVSFDNINKTNGFQPLWLLILIPIFWLKLDCISTLRIIILLTGVISFFTLVFIYKIVKMISSKITAEFCVMLYAFNPFNIIIYLGCSEAALNGLLLSAIFYYILKSDFKKSKGKDFLILGLLSSFSFLARTDNVILIVCLISWVISSGIFKFKKEYIKSFFYFCISVSILPLIYISFNLFYFNHILPISGIVRGMTFYLILFYLIISAIICSIISLIIRIYEFNEKISKILILF